MKPAPVKIIYKKRILRKIMDIRIVDANPNNITQSLPEIIWVNPMSLYVEESYQRALSARSLALIREMVANWDWGKFKLPNCSYDDKERLCVMDGQHTAIAAANHPQIDKIPIALCVTENSKSRAGIFLGINTHRVSITDYQKYVAGLEAGDSKCLMIKEACEKSGAVICRPKGRQALPKVGDIASPSGVWEVIKRKGVPGAVRVISTLIEARRAPINRVELDAVFFTLYNPIWVEKKLNTNYLPTHIRSKPHEEWRDLAIKFRRKNPKMTMYQSLAYVWSEELLPQE